MADAGYWSRYGRRLLSRRAALGGAGVATGSLILAACGGKGNSGSAARSTAGTGATGTAAQAKQGGTISFAGTDPAMWRQPDAHTALIFSVWQHIGKRAIELDGFSKKLVPKTVASWEIPGDGSQFILHVRPNVKIQNKPPANGRTFTAEDLAFNINRIAGKLDSQHAALYQRASTMAGLDHAEAVDQLTCKVVMSHPSSTFLAGLTDIRNALMPKDVVEADLFKDITALAGHGPFMTKDYQDGQKLTLVRHPDYFVQGLPHADGVEWIVLPDAATKISAFASGKIDLFEEPTKEQVPALKAARPDAKLFSWQSLDWYHVRFQVERPPFTDYRVRRAIALALDYKDIADGTWGSDWSYVGALVPALPEAVPSDQVQQLPGYNAATKDKDRQTAKQLMAAAGYPDGEIAWQMLPSSPLPTTANYEIAIRVQDQLKKLWPKMNVQVTPPSDSAAFSRQQAEGNFSAISFKNTSLADAALELGSQWHSPGGGLGSRNYGHFKNADLDALIDKAYVTIDNEARKSLIVDFQKRFAEEWQPAVFLHVPPDRYFVSPKLGGFDQAAGPWWYINYRVAEAADLFWKT